MAYTPIPTTAESEQVVPPAPKITADTLRQKLYEQITAEPKKPSTLERVINALGRAYGVPWDSPEERIRKEQVQRDQQTSRLGTLLTITSAAEKSQEDQRRYEAQVKQAAEARKYAMGRDEKMDQRYEEKRKAEEQTRVANRNQNLISAFSMHRGIPVNEDTLNLMQVPAAERPVLTDIVNASRAHQDKVEDINRLREMEDLTFRSMPPEAKAEFIVQLEQQRANARATPAARLLASTIIAGDEVERELSARKEAGELRQTLSVVEGAAPGVLAQAMEKSGIKFDLTSATGADIYQALAQGSPEVFIDQVETSLREQGVTSEVVGNTVSVLSQKIQALTAPAAAQTEFDQALSAARDMDKKELSRAAGALGLPAETLAQIHQDKGVMTTADRLAAVADMLKLVPNAGTNGLVSAEDLQNITQVTDRRAISELQNSIFREHQTRQLGTSANAEIRRSVAMNSAMAQAGIPRDTADMSTAELMLHVIRNTPRGEDPRAAFQAQSRARQSAVDYTKGLEGLREVLTSSLTELKAKVTNGEDLTPDELALSKALGEDLQGVNRALRLALAEQTGYGALKSESIQRAEPVAVPQEVKPLNPDQKRAVDVMIGGEALPPAQALADFLGVDIHTAAATKLGVLPNGRAITVVDLYQAELARGRTQEQAQKTVASALNKALPDMAKRAIDNTLYAIRSNWSDQKVKESLNNRSSIAIQQLSPKGLRQLVQDLEAIAQNRAAFVLDEGQISNMIYDTISKNLQQDAERGQAKGVFEQIGDVVPRAVQSVASAASGAIQGTPGELTRVAEEAVKGPRQPSRVQRGMAQVLSAPFQAARGLVDMVTGGESAESTVSPEAEMDATAEQAESTSVTPTIDVIIETGLSGHKKLTELMEKIAENPSIKDTDILMELRRSGKIKDEQSRVNIFKELINYRDQLRKK